MKVRRVVIPRRGEIFVPTNGDRSSGIDQALSKAHPVLSSQKFDLRQLPAPSPHTPTGKHEVYWLNRRADGVGWPAGAEEELEQDGDFLAQLQVFALERMAEIGPSARAYMMYGYILRESPLERDGLIYCGVQSQERLHLHVSEGIEATVCDGWYDSSFPSERSEIARFFNLVGERTIVAYQQQLQKFGHPLILQQRWINDGQEEFISRKVYSFSSFPEAYLSVRTLRKTVTKRWVQNAKVLGQTPSVLAGEHFRTLQSAVPNFVFLFPSLLDREDLGTLDVRPVWVFPFTTVAAIEMVTDGGAILDRR